MYGVRSAPVSFIQPCRPTVVTKPPSGPGWAHELKHDGYRLQIHVRDGRVRLYTRHGADWTNRYPRIVQEAARLREPIIIDAEVCTIYRRTASRISTPCIVGQSMTKP